MRRLFLLMMVIALVVTPARAMELTAPEAPDSVSDIMPDNPDSFGEGFWQLLKAAIGKLKPDLAEAGRVNLSLTAAVLLIALLNPMVGAGKKTAEFVCTVSISLILLVPTRSMINLAVETIRQMCDYSKLLLPVMTTALAAQGGMRKSAALYGATAAINTVVSAVVSGLLIPMVYIYLVLSMANSAAGEDSLKKLRDFVKWLTVWALKLCLYGFTGFMGFTGVVSGSTDAAALKATKMAISGGVPVIGGILSEASEAVLVSAGIAKNAAGVYGILAIVAIVLHPFLTIAVQHLLLKLTHAVCGVFASNQASDLIQNFSEAMGMLLAMTGTVCILFLISTVCFMKGVA